MSITTLEAAIARLEELKKGAKPLPWDTYTVPAERKKAGYVAVAADDEEMLIVRHDGGAIDGLLIAALSRTVDPILSVLRGALEEWRDYEAMAGGPVKNALEYQSVIVAGAVALARAILGEVEHG